MQNAPPYPRPPDGASIRPAYHSARSRRVVLHRHLVVVFSVVISSHREALGLMMMKFGIGTDLKLK